MVTFVCDGCQDTVSRSKLEAHCNACSRSGAFSCVDCGRTFYGIQVLEHNSCISEAQKHQGSLYNGAVKSENGKANIQERWVEVVHGAARKASHTYRLPQEVKVILAHLAAVDNIPRKRKKFENFVNNSVQVKSQRSVAEVWDMMESAWAQDKIDTLTAKPKPRPAPPQVKPEPPSPVSSSRRPRSFSGESTPVEKKIRTPSTKKRRREDKESVVVKREKSVASDYSDNEKEVDDTAWHSVIRKAMKKRSCKTITGIKHKLKKYGFPNITQDQIVLFLITFDQVSIKFTLDQNDEDESPIRIKVE